MIGDIYIKFKNYSSKRTEMCCLRRDLFDHIEEYKIYNEEYEKFIPKNYHILNKIGEKPVIPEGKYLGYHFVLNNNILDRYYLICDGMNDLQLLTIFDYEDAVQDFLDKTVQERGYDDVYSCLSYKDDPCEKFKNEAAAVLTWRSQVWITAQTILNQWQNGLIDQPTIDDVINQLPKLEW